MLNIRDREYIEWSDHIGKKLTITVCLCYLNLYIYIYIFRERERARDRWGEKDVREMEKEWVKW